MMFFIQVPTAQLWLCTLVSLTDSADTATYVPFSRTFILVVGGCATGIAGYTGVSGLMCFLLINLRECFPCASLRHREARDKNALPVRKEA